MHLSDCYQCLRSYWVIGHRGSPACSGSGLLRVGSWVKQGMGDGYQGCQKETHPTENRTPLLTL